MTSPAGRLSGTEIRYTGFRECSVADADTLVCWLATHVAESERREDRSARTCSLAAIES
jgi:hypothetical protein